MLTDIAIGQYYPSDSLLHRLDPRLKLIMLFVFITVIFWVDGATAYAFLSLVTVGLIVISHLSFRVVLGAVKPLWWIIAFTFLIHLCSTPGEEMARLWRFTLTWEGLSGGFFLSLRLVLLLVLSALLTFTTNPLKLTDAMEYLLRPFKRLGVPAHELAMMMTIALRFVPTLIEETDRLIKAQKSRGADFSSGNLLARARAVVPILVPLFISAFRRADELAMAMEARCYRGGIGRTHLKVLSIGSLDYAAMAVGTVCVLIAVGLDWAGAK